MLDALAGSNEPEHLVKEAKRYLKGLKGNLVFMKKKKQDEERARKEAQYEQEYARARGPLWMAS